jgi:asparagine synthase (glutamine-hydrolysing)
MCGIFGCFTAGRPLDLELCREQTDTLSHRGPDSAGYFWGSSQTGKYLLHSHADGPQPSCGENWDMFLGHRRLAILDLSPQAAQPMSDPTNRYWIVFNGEIYNFAEIRRELEARGVVFHTDHSDTEVLLLAYIQWGEHCLARLRGMFAFAVLDLQEKCLFLARDRLGKKPLYYRVAADGLSFASELKAILADPRVPRQLEVSALGPDFVHRRKSGFQMPLRRWFNENLGQAVTDRLLDPSGPLVGLCDPKAVTALARRFFQGQQDLSEDLWRLLVLSEWVTQVHTGGLVNKA